MQILMWKLGTEGGRQLSVGGPIAKALLAILKSHFVLFARMIQRVKNKSFFVPALKIPEWRSAKADYAWHQDVGWYEPRHTNAFCRWISARQRNF